MTLTHAGSSGPTPVGGDVDAVRHQDSDAGSRTLTAREGTLTARIGQPEMTQRATARLVGILFIIASAAGVASAAIEGSNVGAKDYLTTAAHNDTRIAIGALFELVMFAAIAAIAVALFPVLKPCSERLALGYVVARTIEVVVSVAGSVVVLLMISSLGHDYVAAGSPAGSEFKTVGDVLVAGRDWANAAVVVAAFGASAVILNYALRRAHLVPRWLANWGLVGALLYFGTGLMVLFGLEPFSAPQSILQVPLGLQEMVFAVWLIVKGFNPTVAEGPARGSVALGVTRPTGEVHR